MLHYGRMLAAAIALLAIGTLPTQAQNQTGPPCFERDTLVSLLADQYGEVPVAAGISGGGLLYEVYTSQAGGTWTITATLPTGYICLLASGLEWRIAERDGVTNPGQYSEALGAGILTPSRPRPPAP